MGSGCTALPSLDNNVQSGNSRVPRPLPPPKLNELWENLEVAFLKDSEAV